MRMREVGKTLTGNAFVFFATLVIHGLPVRVGDMLSGDAPLYTGLADRILLGDWSGVVDSSRLLWTKSIFLALVAGAKLVAPASWPYVIVGMNVVCSAATATLLVSFVRRMTDSVAAAGVAFLFYLASFDVFFWNRFVMTDALYGLIAAAVFVVVARPIVDGQLPRHPILPLVAYLVLATLTRPPGIVLVFPAVLGMLAFWPRRDGRELSPGQRRLLWLAVLIAVLGAVAVRTAIVRDPALWPSDWLRPKLIEFSDREKLGEVVAGQRKTFHEPPETYADHLAIEGARFLRFFQFVTTEYSPRHNLVHVVYYVPLYALGILGVIHGLRTTDRKRRRLVLLALLWLAVFAWYHALTVLLWRYRNALIPQFIVLAACGVDALRAMLASRRAGTIEPSP